ncbi:autotransporter domain-containing protein, partial [Streptobacillus ratti]|uniref:autotransporter domain-containing protein n=1 Tax=Streptobacillus ratti TaxID=1720557 RepID=UPI000AE2C7B8
IKSMDNVTGTLDSSIGDNDTLRLIGNGEVKDKNKFKDFEKINLQNSNWTFSNDEYKVHNEILVENATLNINKATLETKNFVNDKTSTINALENSKVEVTDKFTNKGTISFLKNKKETDIFDIKGNYDGEHGKLLMRTYIEKNKSDMLKIDGTVTGKTGIEISNPNSTLSKRFKGKLKLIETKDSTQDAFNLLNPEHGIYRYKLELENNNWYLTQNYNKSVLGIITNSMDKIRNEYNLTYHDHNKIEDSKNDRLWTKVSNITSNNILVDDKGDKINVDSNTTNIFMGYDIDERNVKDNRYRYGVFGNIMYDRAKTRDENKIGNSGIFGLGVYGTWNNKHFYTDSWLNYTYSQNILETKDRLSYGIHGIKASVEVGTGGDMYVGKSRIHANLYEQLIYSYITNPNVDDIKSLNNSNLRSRLGTNIAMYTDISNVNPYVEFNWNYDVNLAGVKVSDAGYYYNANKNTFELKWGLRDVNLNNKLSVWLNVAHRFNEVGYRANGVDLGL